MYSSENELYQCLFPFFLYNQGSLRVLLGMMYSAHLYSVEGSITKQSSLLQGK